MAVQGWVRTTRHGLDDWRGLRGLGSWRRHEGEGEKRRGKVGLKWMWMLLSPNKVFRLEPRPCQMTSSPAVVPGDCLSVYTVYTTYVSVWGPKKTVDKKRTTQHEAWGEKEDFTWIGHFMMLIPLLTTVWNYLSVHLFTERKTNETSTWSFLLNWQLTLIKWWSKRYKAAKYIQQLLLLLQ